MGSCSPFGMSVITTSVCHRPLRGGHSRRSTRSLPPGRPTCFVAWFSQPSSVQGSSVCSTACLRGLADRWERTHAGSTTMVPV
jgi:hypothetical protein